MMKNTPLLRPALLALLISSALLSSCSGTGHQLGFGPSNDFSSATMLLPPKKRTSFLSFFTEREQRASSTPDMSVAATSLGEAPHAPALEAAVQQLAQSILSQKN